MRRHDLMIDPPTTSARGGGDPGPVQGRVRGEGWTYGIKRALKVPLIDDENTDERQFRNDGGKKRHGVPP